MPDEPSSEIEIYPMPTFPTLAVSDPDGYRLVFNGPVPGAKLRSFDEIVADAAKGFQH